MLMGSFSFSTFSRGAGLAAFRAKNFLSAVSSCDVSSYFGFAALGSGFFLVISDSRQCPGELDVIRKSSIKNPHFGTLHGVVLEFFDCPSPPPPAAATTAGTAAVRVGSRE